MVRKGKYIIVVGVRVGAVRSTLTHTTKVYRNIVFMASQNKTGPSINRSGLPLDDRCKYFFYSLQEVGSNRRAAEGAEIFLCVWRLRGEF